MRGSGAPSTDPVLILTGPPGAGKSTAAQILARRHELGVHVRSDEFYYFIESGLIAPWEPASAAQNALVMDVAADVAARYAGGGYFTIVDGIVQPAWFFAPLRDALRARGLRVAYAILWAPLALCVERVRTRPERRMRDAAVVEQIWNGFADPGPELVRHVVDVEGLSAEEVADRVTAGLEGDLLV